MDMSTYSEAELYYKLDNMILSSSQYLRKTFKNRWKSQNGENWIDSEAQKNQLLRDLVPLDSKTKKCPLPSFQQKGLKEKDVAEWDVSLLSAILLIQPSSDQNTLKENDAIRKLKNIRNALAHDDIGANAKNDDQWSRKCTSEEFSKHADIFRECLLCLGVDEIKINKIIEKSGITSSLKALERNKKLYTVAENLMNKKHYDEAIDCYTDAISTPSLLPEHLAEAYEKRAACYLKYTDRIDLCCDQALQDISRALELNGLSWKTHYTAAKCYRQKNNFSKSIDFYEQALAISPIQTEVKRDLESCQVLSGILTKDGIMNPEQLPQNLQELIAEFEHETGEKLTEDEFIDFKLSSASSVIGGQEVFRGHQYYYGWGVLQNYNEAIKYYTKADKLGNPIGTYNLGLCYAFGRGVEQNLQKALNTFERAAAMDPKTEGEQTTIQRNLGVAAAQHTLGCTYSGGIGVDQNYYKATVWFKKAIDNGYSRSALNMGNLYYRGLGVQRDELMAEKCWKTAMNWGHNRAPHCLMIYYLDQLEPEMAVSMLEVGRKMGNEALIKISDKEINFIVAEAKQQREEMLEKVTKFEAKYSLNTKGWLFRNRVMRYIRSKKSDVYKNIEILMNSVVASAYGVDGGRGVKKMIPEDAMKVVIERARNGSETAIGILKAMDYWNKLHSHLIPIRTYSDAEKMSMIELLYESVVLQASLDLPLDFPTGMATLRSIVQELFEKKCEQIGNDDMKIRLCHVIYNLRGSWRSLTDKFALEVLKEGVRRYPENVTYYDYLSLAYGFKRDNNAAVYWAEEGLKKFPGNISLLYGIGLHLMQDMQDLSKAKDSLLAYIAAAPSDHVKVPQAYYRLCIIHQILAIQDENVRSENNYLIQLYFEQGEKAEKERLPCYVIPETEDQKNIVKFYLGYY